MYYILRVEQENLTYLKCVSVFVNSYNEIKWNKHTALQELCLSYCNKMFNSLQQNV